MRLFAFRGIIHRKDAGMIKKKILIIDDERDFAKPVKQNLERTGKYEALIETRGSRALEVAKKFKPDLILLDIMMPDIPGDRVASQLKGCKDTGNIPVVLLTALVTKEETYPHGDFLGGYPVMAKPLSIETLLNTVKKTIG